MANCNDCTEHPLMAKRMDDAEKFREKLERDGTGTLDRMWTAIENRVSRGMMIAVMTLVIGFMGTLFSLVFLSNQDILIQFGDIKKDIAVISKVVEIQEDRKD